MRRARCPRCAQYCIELALWVILVTPLLWTVKCSLQVVALLNKYEIPCLAYWWLTGNFLVSGIRKRQRERGKKQNVKVVLTVTALWPCAVTLLQQRSPLGTSRRLPLSRFNGPVLRDKHRRVRGKPLRNAKRLQRRSQRLQLLLCAWIYWWVLFILLCLCEKEKKKSSFLFGITPSACCLCPLLSQGATVRRKSTNAWASRVRTEAPAWTSWTPSAADVPPASQVAERLDLTQGDRRII